MSDDREERRSDSEREGRATLPGSLGTPFRPGMPQPAARPREAAPPPAPPAGELTPIALRDACIAALKTCYDPEIPVDIYELGLIYEIEVDERHEVAVVMTLTSPMCPVAETLPPEVESKLRGVPGVKDVRLDLTWEPPWEPAMMSEAARLDLGF